MSDLHFAIRLAIRSLGSVWLFTGIYAFLVWINGKASWSDDVAVGGAAAAVTTVLMLHWSEQRAAKRSGGTK